MFRKLIGLFQRYKIKYRTLEHKKVYTVFDLATVTKVPLKEIAKTLLIKIDQDFVLAVLPGHRKLDLRAFKKIVNDDLAQTAKAEGTKARKIKEVKICSETQIKRNLTDGQPINLLPFGQLYKRQPKVFVDKLLLRNKKITLAAGSFEKAVKITSNNFIKITESIKGSFSAPKSR